MNTTRRKFMQLMGLALPALAVAAEVEADDHVHNFDIDDERCRICGVDRVAWEDSPEYPGVKPDAWRKHVEGLDFWERNAPPQHHNCRSVVFSARPYADEHAAHSPHNFPHRTFLDSKATHISRANFNATRRAMLDYRQAAVKPAYHPRPLILPGPAFDDLKRRAAELGIKV